MTCHIIDWSYLDCPQSLFLIVPQEFYSQEDWLVSPPNNEFLCAYTGISDDYNSCQPWFTFLASPPVSFLSSYPPLIWPPHPAKWKGQWGRGGGGEGYGDGGACGHPPSAKWQPCNPCSGYLQVVGYKYGMNLGPCSISGNRKAFLFFKEQVLSNNFEHSGG